ncbi:cytosine/adenosine deaminase-related metal-dependent hydrolase [Humitalea rosea]|uniref:Cytosine/adenosine deaminase-related metal-dependent hydrolase n=1 Tax=Humitalea rosea TaxID=990373 RepID=A0A2W7IT73_9PROT|nr:amidohydrolase family protein [Humitalea rosea]PZW41873.1 cytosine/adenosine deaminase-related metal-dependent hydrolase [Humitalea rosea]
MKALLLRDIRLPDGTGCDVLVEDGRFAAFGRNLTAPSGAANEDGAGGLLLPGLIEGHTHLDKSLWDMPWYRNECGPLLGDRIANERRQRGLLGLDPARQARAVADRFLALGTTRIRSFADVDTEIGLKHVHALLELREAQAGVQEIQVVAFPQSGLLVRPGTLELLTAAMADGADIVGGLDPSGIDRDPKGHLDAVFALSGKTGKPLDIHLHEPGELGAFALELTVERTLALGMQKRVVISHAFCLGDVAPARQSGLLALLAEAGIALATTAPPSRNVPPVAACRAAGVTIFGGNDGIRDTWTPYGAPDMLQRAMLIGLKNDFRRDDQIDVALDCVTGAAALGCGFSGHGLAVGMLAEAVLVDAQSVAEAVVAQPSRRLVISGGRVVARDNALV